MGYASVCYHAAQSLIFNNLKIEIKNVYFMHESFIHE